jgi:hypothetical protein
MTSPRRHGARLADIHDRFGLLLLFLVGSFVTLGFSNPGWVRYLAAALEVAALVVALLATRPERDRRWLPVLVAIGVLAAFTAARSGDTAAGLASLVLIMMFAAVLVAVLGRVLRHRRVTLQTIYGAVSAYFLIGLMFSSVYGALDNLGDEPLFGEDVSRPVYSYFSFTSLTTVGFGDYTAKTDLGRRVVVIEAVIGQVFIATTLARLVSLYKPPSATPTE